MDRYIFSLVRCVPNPRTGEFINVGALAGSPELGDWSVREIGNEKRVRSLAEPDDIVAVHDLIAKIGFEMDNNAKLVEHSSADPLDVEWLSKLHYDHRNVVQFSKPSIILADNAEAALDLVFEHYLVEPTRPTRESVTKYRAVSALLSSYRRAAIDPRYIHRGVDVVVGDHLATRLDFAIGNGQALQLCQGWSFRVGGVEEIGTQVKSWAYALSRLRDGVESKVLDGDTEFATATSRVERDVELEVVVVLPVTPRQEKVFDEANQVFRELGVNVHGIEDVDAVSARAAELVGNHPGQGLLHRQ